MKNIESILLTGLTLLAGVSFVSCTEEEFQPGPEASGMQVFFPEATQTDYSLDDNTTSVTIAVKRANTEGEYTISVLPDFSQNETDPTSLFTIPESVTFADGADEASLVVSFNRADMEDGLAYSVGLLLNDAENTTPYGYSSIYLTLTPWPWELMGTGKFRDDFLTIYTGVAPTEVEVNIHKHKTQEGVYMLEEPFGWPLLTEALGGTQEELSEQFSYTPTNIEIRLVDNDPNKVYLPLQFTGISENINGYGAHNVGTLADAAGEPQYGTLSEGVITFPERALAIQFEGANQTSYANTNGMFRILLPGAVITDYSLAAEYSGMRVTSDNKTASAVFNFTYGADVAGINYVFAQGNVTADATSYISGIVDGSAENINTVEDLVPGGKTVSVEAVLTTGVYTLVAVPVDASGAAVAENAAVTSFFFPGVGGAEIPECEVGVELFWISTVPEFEEYVEGYPDYSTLGFSVTGKELKSVKYLMATTQTINSYDQSEWAALVEVNGYDLESGDLAMINNDGGYMSFFSGLSASTSYTILILAENDYNKSAIVSDTFSTDAMPYSGELVVGPYMMSCQPDGAEKPFTNVFEVKPTAGSETIFTVAGFGIEDNIEWYAEYDSEKSTLTLDGTAKGYESYGNLFGGVIYGKYDQDGTMVYMFYSYTDENSETGNDPCVLTVDPSSHEVNGLSTIFMVPVFDAATGEMLGTHGYYDPAATVVPYKAETASVSRASSSRANWQSAFLFRPGKMSVKSNAIKGKKMENANIDIRNGSTLSVNTRTCSSLPRTMGSDFKFMANPVPVQAPLK